jgi:hypothetical protein
MCFGHLIGTLEKDAGEMDGTPVAGPLKEPREGEVPGAIRGAEENKSS